ncbi:hypothetical protein ACLOJK_021941 [Asimina triloba]
MSDAGPFQSRQANFSLCTGNLHIWHLSHRTSEYAKGGRSGGHVEEERRRLPIRGGEAKTVLLKTWQEEQENHHRTQLHTEQAITLSLLEVGRA